MQPELQEIGRSIKRLQNRHHHEIDRRLAPLGLSLAQWDTLRHIGQNPDASLHAMAQLTYQSDQAFGTLAKRMLKGGLIEHVPGPGRAIKVRLTEKGAQLREAGDGAVNEVLRDSFSQLTQLELETLDNLLNRALGEAI